MYTNLLTTIKNAQAVGKERIKAPYSNADFAVAEILAKNKYVASVEKKGRNPKRVLEIALRYKNGDRGAITGIQFVSRPSRQIYSGYKNAPVVRQGFGMSVLSTSKGLMTGREAKKNKVGGVLLFKIW